MHLKSVSVLNYKNIEQANLSFSTKLNCFLGGNGAGKTNLLDGIYYLSFTKSFFNASDIMNVRHHEEMFMLSGEYDKQKKNEVVSVGYKLNQKKKFQRNKKVYKRFSEHIGLFPLVMVSPSDQTLISGGSDERRKFIDGVISQFDQAYLNALLAYNRVLQQRNSLLKKFSESKRFDADTLAIYDEQLVKYGRVIHGSRKAFISEITPYFQHFYEIISHGKEKVSLQYQSMLDESDFMTLLEQHHAKDRVIQYTSVGVHKDDLQLNLGDYAIRKLGSQGQTKTYLVALKLAQFEYLKNQSAVKPILLLDDIFDKLDAGRVEEIIHLVGDESFGQIFITDTNREHLDGILKKMDVQHKIFQIEDGKVSSV